MEEITKKTVMFRDAIIKTIADDSCPETMSEFPKGCCGESTLLLSTYLCEQGLGSFMTTVGQKGTASHAWLTHGEYIIDITKSQFEDCPDDIMVTNDSEWHRGFTSEATCENDLIGEGESQRAYYEIILAALSGTSD
ncbi:MAG: hypothetical protein HRU05_11750 [Oceanospirillaceae bacterium]|nr:hypothetical protein [Oceanospirillaceae bacterium]